VNGNWTYSYDDFGRLSTSGKSGQGFNYKYDRFSNRWQQNLTAGSGPAPQYSFDANNRIIGSGITYDAAGNIMNDGFHSYSYDAEGHLMSVDGTAASYLYNASGQRVESTTPSNKIDFIYDQTGAAITEATASSWARSELYAGGLHVASYANSTTYFDHSDWQGTVRALSTVSGTNSQNCPSLPFGDALQNCTGSPWYPLQFTGDEHDNESNLEHTLFRQYSGTQGRWTVPDPAGLAAVDPTNPQTWNRYAYVMNNPLSYTDPLGLDSIGVFPCPTNLLGPNTATEPSYAPGNVTLCPLYLLLHLVALQASPPHHATRLCLSQGARQTRTAAIMAAGAAAAPQAIVRPA
jgi:RHS repeat-associated protein